MLFTNINYYINLKEEYQTNRNHAINM